MDGILALGVTARAPESRDDDANSHFFFDDRWPVGHSPVWRIVFSRFRTSE
jgi:hypothetical protein